MAYRFILGDTGTKKSTKHYHKIMEAQLKGEKTIVIVPEQYTLQTQRELIDSSKVKGLLHVEVLSFLRLVHRFYDYLDIKDKKTLTDTGVSMLIRRIIHKNQSQFTFVTEQKSKHAYMSELAKIIKECYQYNLDDEALEEMLTKVDNKVLYDKLADVKLLYRYFKEMMEEDYITMEEAGINMMKNQHVKKQLQNMNIVIDNFYGFTPYQYEMIRVLVKEAKSVTFIITIDSDKNLGDMRYETDLFYEAKKMISTIRSIAQEEGCEEEEKVFYQEKKTSSHEDIVKISNRILRYPIRPLTKKTEALVLLEAQTMQEEIEVCAKEIHRLITKEGYRYNEIYVLCSDIESYEMDVHDIFTKYEIAYFIDHKKKASNHPLATYMMDVLKTIVYDMRYEDTISLLKSVYDRRDGVTPEQVDILENKILARGIKGAKKWENPWFFEDDEVAIALEASKNLILTDIVAVKNEFKKARTVETKTKVVVDYFKKHHVEEINEELIKDFEEKGDIEKGKVYKQLYDNILLIFEEMVELLGEYPIGMKEYVDLFETAVSQITLHVAPPTIDRITVGNVERTRFTKAKALFILGANEGLLPRVGAKTQFMNDNERKSLLDAGATIAPDRQKSLFKEQMNMYMAFSKAVQKLYVSFTRATNQEHKMAPATIFMQLRKIAKYNKVLHCEDIIKEYTKPSRELPIVDDFIRLSWNYHGEEKEARWIEKYGTWIKEAKPNHYRHILHGLTYKNSTNERKENIHTKDISTSVSRLELFASCPFAHYVQYELQAKERTQYLLQMPDIGNLFHLALESYMKKVTVRQLDIVTIDEETNHEVMEEAILEVLHLDKMSIFYSSHRNQYLIKKLTRILKRTVWAIRKQLNKGAFRPAKMEYRFDYERFPLESLSIQVDDTHALRLRGVVDRIDEYDDENGHYFSVIDYKSSNRSIDLVLAANGIQIQLFIYLKAVREIKEKEYKGKNVLPSGMFYYHIHDPLLEVDKKDIEEEEHIEAFRLNGLVLEDDKVIELFDKEFVKSSSVVPVTRTKDGYAKRSKTISFEDLKTLQQRIDESASETAKGIYQVRSNIIPYTYKDRTSCEFCSYRSICRFDTTNDMENYRELEE